LACISQRFLALKSRKIAKVCSAVSAGSWCLRLEETD
jgi:hypothetical protein